jgi:hypothetical protein
MTDLPTLPVPDFDDVLAQLERRAERTVSDFAAVAEEWDQVDVAALSEKQRVRALTAVEELRQRVERLQARLNGR